MACVDSFFGKNTQISGLFSLWQIVKTYFCHCKILKSRQNREICSNVWYVSVTAYGTIVRKNVCTIFILSNKNAKFGHMFDMLFLSLPLVHIFHISYYTLWATMSAHGSQRALSRKSTKSNKPKVAQAKTIEYFLRTSFWSVLISSQNIKIIVETDALMRSLERLGTQ